MKTISLDSQSFTMVAPESDADLAELIPLITPAYKRVFGDAIWREGWKCSICKKSFAFSDPLCENGQCCGQILQEFYSDQDVANMLGDLLVKRFQLRAILANNNEVAGFQWGWVDSLLNINVKLDLFPEILRSLQQTLQDKGLYQARMYYWSESGVLPESRRLGLAKAMYGDIATALAPSVRSKLLRTTPQSPQYTFSRSRGDEVVFNYTDNTRDRRVYDDRVILAGIL